MRRDQANRFVVGHRLLLTTDPNLSVLEAGYKQALGPKGYQRLIKGRPRALLLSVPPLTSTPALTLLNFGGFPCGQAAVRRMNCAPCRWNAAWSNMPRVPAWSNSATPMCW